MKIKEVNDVEVKHSKSKKSKKNKKLKLKARKRIVKKTTNKLQWPTWKAPFQPGSNLHTFSRAMAKKGGLTRKKFNKLVNKTGAKASWILKCLRKGSAGGWSWVFDDSRDSYRITEVKLHQKAR